MQSLIRVLYIEDDPAAASLVKTKLEQAGCRVDLARGAEEGMAKLSSGSWEIVLVDQPSSPDGGLELIYRLVGPTSPPLIMILASSDLRRTLEVLRSGGQDLDFIVKDTEGVYVELLPHAIKHALERRGAEKSLRESEKRYRALVERIPAVTYVAALDEASTTLYVSPQIQSLIGFTPEEYRANPDIWRERLHPEDRDRVLAEVARCHATGEPFLSEYRMIARDGREVWCHDEAVIFRDESGTPLFLQGVMYDITERKKAEVRLDELNKCLVSLGHDFEANVNKLTALCGELTGATCAVYSRIDGRLLNSCGQWHTPSDFNPKDKPEGHICYDVIMRGEPLFISDLTGTIYEKTDPNVAKYGLRSYFGHPVRCLGEVIGSLCVVFQHRVTLSEPDRKILGIVASAIGREEERKAAQQALEESEERFRMLFNHVSDAVFVHQPEQDGTPGHFIEVNDMACRRYGYSREELLRMTPLELVAPEIAELLPARIQRVIEERQLFVDSVHVTKSGERFPVEVHSYRFDLKGRLTILSVARDVTERRRAEQALREAQRLRSIRDLAAGVAHNFNNLLSGVIGYGSLLKQNLAKLNISTEYVDKLLQCAERAAFLSSNLRIWAESQFASAEKTPLESLINEIVNRSRGNLPPTIRLSTHISSGDALVHGSLRDLAIALGHICDNAIEAMPNGGELSIFADVVRRKRGDAEIDFARIRISDTGKGIPRELMPRLFEPFFSTKGTVGVGLSLALTRKIVEEQGGFIEVQSTPGQGSTFSVFLPVAQDR